MASITDLLAAHPSICAECITRHSGTRTDHVFHELELAGAVLAEGRCGACDEVTPVYSVSRQA